MHFVSGETTVAKINALLQQPSHFFYGLLLRSPVAYRSSRTKKRHGFSISRDGDLFAILHLAKKTSELLLNIVGG